MTKSNNCIFAVKRHMAMKSRKKKSTIKVIFATFLLNNSLHNCVIPKIAQMKK